MKLEEDFRNLDEPSIDYQVQGWRSWRKVEHRGGEDHSKTDQDLYFSFKFLRSNQIKSNQVEITRRRIRMMITPDWSVKRAMGLAKSVLGGNPQDNTTPPTENLLMRLAFHDCIPYQGGKISGGKGWLLF